MATVPALAQGMTEEQQAIYFAQLNAYQKDEVAGVLLALFLGTFGAHCFYLGQTGRGVLYLVFCWTGIPTIVSFVECFLMPGRVRRYNFDQAMMLAGSIRGGAPQAVLAPAVSQAARHCPSCGTAVAAGVRFCGKCGTAVASA